jgi:hypothetical protein
MDTKPRRKYYLHKRRNGIYYAEIINTITHKKGTAKSTGETEKEKAIEIVESWLKNGHVPIRKGKCSIKNAETADSLISSIRKATLSKNDAMRIISSLVIKGLINFKIERIRPLKYNEISHEEKRIGVLERYKYDVERFNDILKKEKREYTLLKEAARNYYRYLARETGYTYNKDDEEAIRLRMQFILLNRKVKIKQGAKNGRKTDERG